MTQGWAFRQAFLTPSSVTISHAQSQAGKPESTVERLVESVSGVMLTAEAPADQCMYSSVRSQNFTRGMSTERLHQRLRSAAPAQADYRPNVPHVLHLQCTPL